MMQFNTHEAYKQLVNTGMKDKTAEKLVEIMNQARLVDFENLATKQDLKVEISNIKSELKEEIAEVKAELKEEIGKVRLEISELRGDIKGINSTLSTGKWFLGAMIIPVLLMALKMFFPALFGV